MLFNDLVFLEFIIILSLLFYLMNVNILMLLYAGFIFLLTLGFLLLLNDADIYVGFLWLIDMGVGLVFFIFILHFSTFLSQKSQVDLSLRSRFLVLISFFTVLIISYSNTFSSGTNYKLHNSWDWFLKLSHIDYYLIYSSSEISELNTLKESYFFLNSYEFFIINFSLLFGLISAVIMFFLIKRIFLMMNYNYVTNSQTINKSNTNFFIRTQDYVKQQRTFMTVRSWIKVKKKTNSKDPKQN